MVLRDVGRLEALSTLLWCLLLLSVGGVVRGVACDDVDMPTDGVE